MNYRRYLIVKLGKFKKWFFNTNLGYWLDNEIYYFKDYGFWYGLKLKLFPPLSNEKFLKKIINYELRHYKGVDYDYLMNLPKKPVYPYKKLDKTKNEFIYEYWIYMIEIINILKNIYNGNKQEFQDDWLRKYKFNTVEEYIKYKKYYFKLYPKTKAWKVNKHEIEQSFSWFDMQYGLMYDFDYNEIREYEKNNKK